MFVKWVFVADVIVVKKLYYTFCAPALVNKIRYDRWILSFHIYRPGSLTFQFTKINKNPILSHTARLHKQWCIKPKHKLNNLQRLIKVVKGTRYFLYLTSTFFSYILITCNVDYQKGVCGLQSQGGTNWVIWMYSSIWLWLFWIY